MHRRMVEGKRSDELHINLIRYALLETVPITPFYKPAN